MPADEERQHAAAARFGENLRAVREHRGLSQPDLAREMTARGHPWHQSTVYKTEHGKRVVGFHEAEDLAAILGTTTDRFTWLPPEAAETALADRAAAILHCAAEDAANAVAALHAARAGAERAIAEHGSSRYRRVRQACSEIAAELADATDENVLAEGTARWQRMKAGG